jgi:predicted aconitase
VYLSNEEEKALKGEYGEAIELAYRILVAIGEATNAEKLIEVEWAHISGVNYNTIGDAGLKFLEDLSEKMKGEKVKIKSTLNPMGYDPYKSAIISKEFKEKQERIRRAYEKMGIIASYTCIPYQVYEIPERGKHVSFAESNAAIFANSILGLKTNKESALSALASAITGKSPYSGLRLEEFRKPRLCIRVKKELKNELEYGLLGYFAGIFNEYSIAFDIKNGFNEIYAKSLSASLGTSGSAGMFELAKKDSRYEEAVEYDEKESKEIFERLSNSDKGDLIVFGSPQLGMEELRMLSILLRKGGRKFKKKCILFCARKIYNEAKKFGYVNELERAGVEIYCDSCSCLTPLVDKKEFDSVITNSVKACYYLRNWNKVNVSLKSMKEIVEEECE